MTIYLLLVVQEVPPAIALLAGGMICLANRTAARSRTLLTCQAKDPTGVAEEIDLSGIILTKGRDGDIYIKQ